MTTEKKDAVEVKTNQTEQSAVGNQQGATPGVENKGTAGTTLAGNQPFIVKGDQYNVLHDYRSWNYVFTLSALEDAALSKPAEYENSSKKYIIAKTSGKGSQTVSNSLNSKVIADTTTNKTELIGLIEDFNKNSPGRFDFFIDNVKISSLMSYTPTSTTSLPQRVSFDVFEPYSMGGFLEALQVTSKAAGAISYPAGHFCLKIEFIGYSDKATGPDGSPVVIPSSTRFYPMQISKVTVETTDKGTTYHVTGTPIGQKAFGAPNNIKSDIKMTGKTVGEVLTNFIDNLNKAKQEEAKDAKGNENTNVDRYEIFFAKLETPDNPVITMGANKSAEWKESGSIYAAELNNELRGNPIYAFADPASATTTGHGYVGQTTETSQTVKQDTKIKYEPGNSQVSFSKGSKVSDILEAVIRDSEYTKTILKTVDEAKKGDGMVTYFMIRTEVETIGDKIDPQELAKNKLYRFIIVPYPIHYTRLPGEQLGVADFTPIKNKIRRTYDYLYMGKNKDVINFNLKFNNLYFQAMPPRMGKTDSSPTSSGAAAGNTVNVEAPKAKESTVKEKENPTARVITIPEGYQPAGGVSGQAKQSDPYHNLVQTMHNAIVQSVDLATCTIDIYGDPYYLTTGGIGNQSHPLASKGITKNGEAPLYAGEVYVNINWRTPIDYNTFEKGGSTYFESKILPFSGIYKVTEVSSDLAGGVFKQTLKLLRMPGQLIEAKKVDVSAGYKTSPKPGDQQVKDIAPIGVQTSGSRPNEIQLASLVRGLPSAGAPGAIPNFVNAAGGGIGGLVGAVTGGLTSVAGVGGAVQNIVGQVKTIAPQLGLNVGSSLNGVNALASGIRLATSGVSNIIGGASKLIPATVASVDNLVNRVVPTANSAATLASGVTNQVASAGGSISNLTGSAVNSVKNLAGGADSLVNNVQANVASVTQGIPNVDPTAIAARAGIDPAQLSGLDPSLKAKVLTQLQDLQNNIPDNVDINAFKGQGLVMANVTADNIRNLPPIQAETQSVYEASQAVKASLVAGGTAVPEGSYNLSGISKFNQLTNTLGQSASGLTAGLGSVSTTALTDKLTSAQASLNNIVGGNLNVTNGLTGLIPAQAGLGSVESNIAAVNNMTQSGSDSLAKTAASKFGSLRTASPLDSLVASANKGNVNNGWGEG